MRSSRFVKALASPSPLFSVPRSSTSSPTPIPKCPVLTQDLGDVDISERHLGDVDVDISETIPLCTGRTLWTESNLSGCSQLPKYNTVAGNVRTNRRALFVRAWVDMYHEQRERVTRARVWRWTAQRKDVRGPLLRKRLPVARHQLQGRWPEHPPR
jgi:hypothetical protein